MNDSRVIFRSPSMNDISALEEMERKVWGENMFASREKWKSRISIFSEGICIAERSDEIIGVVATLILDWRQFSSNLPSWFEVSGDGMGYTHNNQGNVLYGIDLSAVPGQEKIGSSLVQFTKDLRLKLRLPGGGLGCRIPSLAKYVKKNNISFIDEIVVKKAMQSDLHLDFWKGNGFNPVKIIRDYFPVDEESLGWGVLMCVDGGIDFWS